MAKKKLPEKESRPAVNKSVMKMAQERIFNTVQEMEDMLAVLNTFSRLGHAMFYADCQDQKIFLEGLNMARMALRNKYSEIIMMALPMIGAGGDEAKAFSRKQFRKYFGEETPCVTRFLNKYGVATSWSQNDELIFREEAKDILSEHALTDTSVKRKLVISRPGSSVQTSESPETEKESEKAPSTKPSASGRRKRPAIIASVASMLDALHPGLRDDSEDPAPAPVPEPDPAPDVEPWADDDDDCDF